MVDVSEQIGCQRRRAFNEIYEIRVRPTNASGRWELIDRATSTLKIPPSSVHPKDHIQRGRALDGTAIWTSDSAHDDPSG